MGFDFKRYQTGELFRVTQRTANAMVGAAEAFDRHAIDPGEVATSPTYRFEGSLLVCRNDTGADLARFDVAGLDSALITPVQNLPEFQNYPRFSLATPAVPTHVGRFGVCTEPIAAGAVGNVLVNGVVPAKVFWNVPAHAPSGFADVQSGQTYLVPSGMGAAQILWADTLSPYGGAGTVWALVRLGPGQNILTGTLHSALSDADGAALCDLVSTSGQAVAGGPHYAYNLMGDAGPAGTPVVVMPNPGYIVSGAGNTYYSPETRPPYVLLRVRPSTISIPTDVGFDLPSGSYWKKMATIAATSRSDAATNASVLIETQTSYIQLAPTSNDAQRDNTTTAITGVSPSPIVWGQSTTVSYHVAHSQGVANPQGNVLIFASTADSGPVQIPIDSTTALDSSGNGTAIVSRFPKTMPDNSGNVVFTLVAQYMGDTNYNASQSASSGTTLTVGRAALSASTTLTNLSVGYGNTPSPPDGYDATYGDTLEIDVAVLNSSGSPPALGEFTGQIWLVWTNSDDSYESTIAIHGYDPGFGGTSFLLGSLPAGAAHLKARVANDPRFAEADATVTVNVAKQPLTLTMQDATKVFGDPNPAFTYSVDQSALRLGDSGNAIRASGAPVFTTSASQSSGVGSYSVDMAVGTLSSANYSLQVVGGNLTVTAAPLKVTANNQTMTQGQDVPAITGTVSGIKNGDAITFRGSTLATSSSPVGSYVIRADAFAAAGVLNNYILTTASAVLTIVAAVSQ
jgi:hypothetical protein